jgi:2-C-methyl-D-erythritol 4-phosphate cytidylyltransferase
MSLIVPAAGCGARAAQNGNKILAPLVGQPLLFHTLHHLLQPAPEQPEYGRFRPYLQELIIAARREEWSAIQSVWDAVRDSIDSEPPQFQLVEGGATRQDSVLAAVRSARGNWVAVHDAARPFASRTLLETVWRGAQETGAAIAALPASDTVKQAQAPDTVDAGAFVEHTLERGSVWLVQTPQVFRREILRESLEAAVRDSWAGTDCASAVERLKDEQGNNRVRVALVEGDALNFKVTFAPDLARAEWMLRSNVIRSH